MQQGYSKLEIDRTIQIMLDDLKYRYDEFPVNPIDIAKKLDLQVFETQFKREDISGMINAKTKEILISSKDPIVRQRFSIAHEIGHFVLHYNGVDSYNFDDDKIHISYRDNTSTLGFDIREIEANYFAAVLLMPEKQVREVYWQNKSIERVASFFWVSNSAAAIRLQYLGLIA